MLTTSSIVSSFLFAWGSELCCFHLSWRPSSYNQSHGCSMFISLIPNKTPGHQGSSEFFSLAILYMCGHTFIITGWTKHCSYNSTRRGQFESCVCFFLGSNLFYVPLAFADFHQYLFILIKYNSDCTELSENHFWGVIKPQSVLKEWVFNKIFRMTDSFWQPKREL